MTAASLPEENAQVSVRYYSGDDTTITSSHFLIRKNINNQYGLSLTQIRDNTRNGSVDVQTQASVDTYSENRDETSLGLNFLNNGTLMLMRTSYGDEPDYRSSTLHLDISQEMFGNTSTFGFGFSRGWDVVGRTDTETEWDLDRQNLRFVFSQAMSKRWLSQLSYEHISEQGEVLGNPYLAAVQQGALVAQHYPQTRVQHSVSFTNRLFFHPRSVAVLNYRYFTDSWDISSHTFSLTHIKPVNPLWDVDLHYRFYRQNAASFFFDNADQSYLYLTRDKIVSQYNQHTFGVILSYVWGKSLSKKLDNVTLNASFDFMRFTYDGYTNIATGEVYGFDAYSIQVYIAWPF
ncbi:MAG: DUF3570 domain-containing protein [Pseudomonadales bacterium]|nr:DUF3570 domain-containing protein [Pseudomonadales bacterium]